MADVDVNLSFGVGNPDDIARQLEAIINKAAKKLGDQLTRSISNSIKKGFQDAFGKIDATGATQKFNKIQQAIKQSSNASNEFAEKVDAIRKRNEELSRSFGASGLGGATSKFFDLNLRSLSALQEQLNRTDLSPELRRQFQLRFDTVNAALVKESSLIRRASIVQQQADSEASKASRANLETTSREKIELLRAQSRQQALLSQQETTKIAAAARLELSNVQTKNRSILINERAAAQQRVAITQTIARISATSLRFITQQTQFLSRVAVNSFRTIGQAGASAFKGIANASRSFFGVFSRSQKQFDDDFKRSIRNRKSASNEFYKDQELRNRASLRRQRDDVLETAKQTNDGVLALAKKSGLLGIGAGFAAGTIVRRTIREQFAVGGDFVQSLAVLQAQLGLTEEAVKSIRDQSLALGNDISLPGVSAKDAAEGISLLVKQFGALGDGALPAAQAAARGVLLLSRATNSAAEEAAAGLGAAVNVFGVSADEADKIANQFVQTVSSAAGATFTDLSEAIKGGASVFATFQRPAVGATQALIDFQAAVASLAKGGLVGADAGQALKSLFLTANRSGKATTDALNEVANRAGVAGSVLFDQSGQARSLFDSLEILRNGLKGLTDAQRASTLQTIFGSRGINAANILIGQSAEEQENLRKAIAESGIAAEIAAAQNTGLRGAFDALSSVIETNRITTYEKYQATLGRIVLTFAELLDQFFNGVGVFKLLKPAINGVVVALGGLVAIKGIIELFGLLNRRIRLLFTPLGIFLATVAAIGATFNVLRKVSEPFNNALKRLGDTFRNVGKRIRESLKLTSDGASNLTSTFGVRFRKTLERVGLVLAGLINLFIDRVLPAFRRVARAVRNVLEPAFNAVRAVIVGVFIPAIEIARAAIEELLLPAIVDLGRKVGEPIVRALGAAGNAIVSFARTVQPIVQPTIDAFKELGSALSAAFRGDFSQLGSALKGLGSGAAATAKNIGAAIVGGLESLKTLIGAKFRELFSPANVLGGARTVLEFVETLGRILGRVVTDPRLLAAVAGIGAVAAVVAFKFLEGFAQGVFKNIKIITGIGVSLAAELGKSLLNPKNLALAAGVAVVAASIFSLLKPLIVGVFGKLGLAGSAAFAGAASKSGASGKFGAAGIAAGKSFAGGFLSATKNLFTQGAQGFAQTPQQRRTLGGDPDQPAGVAVAGGAPRAFITGLFGGPKALDDAGTKAVSRAYAAANRQLRVEFAKLSRLSQQLGRGPLSVGAARVTEDTIARAREQLQPFIDSYGRAGLAAIRLRSTIQGAFAGINNIVRGSFAILKGDLAKGSAQFQEFGQRVKASLAALRAQTGSIVKAIGRTISTGIQGAIGGVFAGQALGQATDKTGAAIGVAALAATSLAIGAINPAAGVAAFGVGLLTAAFTKSATKAKAYAEDVKGVSDALLSVGTASEQGRLDVIVNALNQEFFKSERTTKFLNRIKLPTSEIAKALLEGRDAAQEFFARFRQLPGIEEIVKRFGITSINSFEELQSFVFRALIPLQKALEGSGISIEDLNAAVGSLGNAISLTGGALETEQFKLERFALELDNTADSAQEAKTRVSSLFDASRNFLSAQIDEINSKLGLARSEADKARGALQAFFGGEYQQSFEGLRNRLLLDSKNIGSAIAEGLEEGGDIGAARISETLNATLAPQLGALADAATKEFAKTFGENFVSPTEGPFADIDKAEWIKLKVLEAATKGITDPKVRDTIATFVGDLFDRADASLLVEQAVVTSEAVSQLQTQLDEINTVKLQFDIDSVQLAQQLEIATGSLAKIAEAGPSFINLINTGNTLGGAISKGLTEGLSDPLAVRAVVDAAGALARKIEPEIRRILNSRSPSRVMIDVGKDVANGLAIGIEQGTTAAIKASSRLAEGVKKELQVKLATPAELVRELGLNIGREIAKGIADSEITIGQAVSAAVSGAFEAFTQDERIGASIAGALSEIFKRNLPTEVRATGVTELDLRQAFGGLTPALNVFADSIAQVGTEIQAAQEKLRKGEPLSASERALAAASPISLGADVAGSRNVQAFVTAGTVVRDYFGLLLAGGRSLESATFEVKAWRDNLVQSALAAGFSAGEVAKLVEQLGLSNAQLEEFGRQARTVEQEAVQPAVSRREEEERRRKEEEEERKRKDEEEERKRKEEADEEDRKREAEAQQKREDDLRERLRRLEDPRFQRNLVQNISVTVPYGDPQAVALATANRVAATVNRR